MASIESLLQEWEKVAPKATDEVAEFVPMYGNVPFCNIKRRNLTTRFAGASPILGETLQRHCEHTDKHQFTVQILIDRWVLRLLCNLDNKSVSRLDTANC